MIDKLHFILFDKNKWLTKSEATEYFGYSSDTLLRFSKALVICSVYYEGKLYLSFHDLYCHFRCFHSKASTLDYAGISLSVFDYADTQDQYISIENYWEQECIKYYEKLKTNQYYKQTPKFQFIKIKFVINFHKHNN